MGKSPFRFCLNSSQSPAFLNLQRYLQEQGWQASRFKWLAAFSEVNLQFDTKAAEALEFKHHLAALVARYCPQVMPLTYCINDQNWPLILTELAANHYQQGLADQIDNLIWILKPALLNNGQQIKIFQTLSALEQHFLSSQRLGGEHVLQQYLAEPHLLRDSHKYSIRLFVVLTNYRGVYLYPKGYFNVALHPFDPRNFTDLRPHLTNEHLSEEESNVVQIPSARFDIFSAFYPQIKAISSQLIRGLEQRYPDAFICKKHAALAIFGFDFMVDRQLRLWLLEANHGPCFPVSDEHPLQKHLYHEFWQDLIHSFVLPIARRRYDSPVRAFEKI